MVSDLERILRGANLSIRTAFVKPRMSRDAADRVKTLERALESDIEAFPSSLARKPAHPAAPIHT